MFLSYLVVVISANMMLIQSHDCNDYDRLASDQSLIDMMTHCLHTCIKPAASASGVTYVRWGKKACPKGVELVYTGQVGGNQYTYKGGGVTNLSLPNDPENGEPLSGTNDQIVGGQYELTSPNRPSGMKSTLTDNEVPCAVCYQRKRSTVLMIPGRKTCYKGWTFEYTGYIMSDHKDHSSKEYVCVDKDAEPVDDKNKNENGALFYGVKTNCGSLRCPPYKNAVTVHCVVCTK
ncbi:short-chain collagen C4-like isoform X3 [Mytilus californianus]|uniref:short-chain collagen C4-like isoform X3 n=1 Tax=Mytilus californianus TaxID=6549 RepID=UPI002247430F|nr:short-chain collagen C4-like isoform X3 [Mytilus californianus]